MSFSLVHEEEDRWEPFRWMRDKVMTLVTTETLPRVVDECINAEGGFYSLDVESTGLNVTISNRRTTACIVGICLSPDGIQGYYVPLRHVESEEDRGKINVSHTVFMTEMSRLIESPAVAVFHNGKYDHEELQFSECKPLGLWEDPTHWEDTNILCYLRNTKERSLKLKDLAWKDLRIKMIRLKELFPTGSSERNYSLLDPRKPKVLAYGCSDGIATYLLYCKVKDESLYLPEGAGGKPETQRVVYLIEKSCVTATRWMERPGVMVSRPKLAELTELGQREYMDSLRVLYSEAPKVINRDVTPLSFVLLEERIAELNPELLAFSSETQSDRDKNFGVMREWAREEAERLEKVYRIHGIEYDLVPQRYKTVLEREAPSDRWASYDVTIPGQLGMLLEELGVPVERTEKSKQIKTSRDVLDNLVERYVKVYPFLKKIRRFREIDRTLGVYLYYLYEDMRLRWVCRDCHHHTVHTDITKALQGHPPESGLCSNCNSNNIFREDRVRVQFRGHRVDTGRFSVKGGKNPKKDGVCRVPFQGFPNQYDDKRPECMRRLRECVIAPEGWTLAAVDFDGVELRIVTNLSREPKWMREYFRCSDCNLEFSHGDGKETPEPPPPFCPRCGSDAIGDLHSLTALGLFGEGARAQEGWKKKRQMAKNTNFSLCYGGSWRAVRRQTGCETSEAHRIKNRFDIMYEVLPAWWRKMQNLAKRRGYVVTAFNRKYPLPDANNEDSQFQSKALRNAINSPVQGTSADITKLAMALLYVAFRKEGWIDPVDHLNDKIRMIITLHDELVFEILNEILEPALEIINRIMTRNKKILHLRWPVPLTVDTELGQDWSVPHSYRKYLYGIKPWPPELVAFFPKGVAFSKQFSRGCSNAEAPDQPGTVSSSDSTPASTSDAPSDDVQSSGCPGAPSVCSELIHEVSEPWTMALLSRLANAIVESTSEDGYVLFVRGKNGETLAWPDGSVRVHPQRFLDSLKRQVN